MKNNIHILFDLIGHGGYTNKIEIVYNKPAPIIINYLGLPDSTYLKSHDYRLVDKITDPINKNGDIINKDKLSTEKYIHIEKCFLCY
jgi:predicted O-linked N-acetylglucosamine transferase (SPINDLY family)